MERKRVGSSEQDEAAAAQVKFKAPQALAKRK
jgi:hypothetical protein